LGLLVYLELFCIRNIKKISNMTREEAIKEIKSWAIPSERGREVLETLIPELAESEDERIRKELVAVLEDLILPDDQRRRFLAYLEKQKERGPLTKEEEYILHRIIEYLEDETCPSEWISLLHDIYCLPYEKQKEQKQEWSEEDEKLLDFWLDVIDRNDWRMDENFCKASREFINRIKSLRLSWKPSEEQMKAIEHAYNSFPNNCPTKSNLRLLYRDLEKLM